ncbi:FadR/GntR family transcriptional regulator [Sphingobium arseniciresistens]|uniref:FadR/GntR family transcriptional regulator n=1 Tax=Sphingobium arseniciresistens TaxID=3030834 RepID=UPI0023B8D03A
MPGLHRDAKRGSSTVSQTLGRKLQDAILSGRLQVGSSLGSERHLMAQYRCSRATVREALRGLRGQGLIEVKRGRNGGWFISDPSHDPLVQSLDRMIKGHTFRWIDLVNAREAIEAAAAVQAAHFPDEEKLAKLREANEECERSLNDLDAFVDANLRWHVALAEASGNALFVAFLNSMQRAMHSATDLEEFDASVRKAVIGIHWQIYNAIRDGDPDAARRRTLRHLSAYRRKLTTVDELPSLENDGQDGLFTEEN